MCCIILFSGCESLTNIIFSCSASRPLQSSVSLTLMRCQSSYSTKYNQQKCDSTQCLTCDWKALLTEERRAALSQSVTPFCCRFRTIECREVAAACLTARWSSSLRPCWHLHGSSITALPSCTFTTSTILCSLL